MRYFNKVELNNNDINVNDNDLSSNHIIVNDLDARQNIDSLPDDCITYRHGSSRDSRSQSIVFDNCMQNEENSNNEQPFMNWEDFGNSYEEIVGVLESDSTQEAEPKFLDSSAITAGNLLDDDLIVLEDASSWEIIYLNDLSADNTSSVTNIDHSINDSLLQPSNTQTGIFPRRPLPVEASSSVNLNLLASLLDSYPITSRAQFLIHGFLVCFDIGFRDIFTETRPRILRSASHNAPGITEAIIKELNRGFTAGPFLTPPFRSTHVSPLGAVAKPDGTCRLILDLSSPRGSAVNEGISRLNYSVTYSKFDDAIKMVAKVGRNCALGKIDLKHAFRIIPVRPEDWPLLVFRWHGYFFVDLRLPFGSRSSPYIFNEFAIVLAWLLVTVVGISFLINYLDDFLLVHFSKALLDQDMKAMLRFCKDLGVPINADKIWGPAYTLTYLGIEIDSEQMVIRLPPDKLRNLKALLDDWLGKKKCTKRELLSLIGKLSFACKCVKPGRIFLRRLIRLSTSVNQLNFKIHLNKGARDDIKWWRDCLVAWNGVSIIQDPPVSAYKIALFSDASGIGFGAYFGKKWLYSSWPDNLKDMKEFDIQVKELFAIVAAIFTWGESLSNKQIILYSDNLDIVRIWHTGSSKNDCIMTLIRALFLYCASKNINLILRHVYGHLNKPADALSRLQIALFHKLRPRSEPVNSTINADVWTILSQTGTSS